MQLTNKDIENINKLYINRKYTLENGDIIKAIKDNIDSTLDCINCYFRAHQSNCHKIRCCEEHKRIGRIFIKVEK